MGNNALDAMDTAWEGTGVMEMFYESRNQSRGGGPGGKDFVGHKLRDMISTESLEELALMLGPNGSSWIEYLESLREVYKVAVKHELDTSFQDKIDRFKEAFNVVNDLWGLSETPKVHIVSCHLGEFLSFANETLWTCSDENLEGCHQLVKRRGIRHNTKSKTATGSHKRKLASRELNIFNCKNKRFKK